MDLGYVGAAFTWSHRVREETRRATSLYSILCDDTWRCLFPFARVRHLTHSRNDHCLLLPQLEEGPSARLGDRLIRFEAAWLLHKDFCKLLDKEWRFEGDLARNKATFVNIFTRKRIIELRLRGVQ